MSGEHIHFVTGRLAKHALEQVLVPLAAEIGFSFSTDVMPITVAALMTPAWIAKRIAAPPIATQVLIPGYCTGDLSPLEAATGLPVTRGPRDLRRLPDHFGRKPLPTDYGAYGIEILAEINHCPRLSIDEILRQAQQLAKDGANIIDIGCDPGQPWGGVADAVKALTDDGHRVSIDSFNPQEIEMAVRAGAELVLSVNASNRDSAVDWGCEVVVIPDDPKTLAGLDETINILAGAGIPIRIDPVLEPVGFGFAQSLQRYLTVRKKYPDAELMMGIGNLTELTDVDSAGINVLLIGFCQELAIGSILTTEVINWARTSVRECDLARRLMYHAVRHQVLPKHLEPQLLTLRDETPSEPSPEDLQRLATTIKDNNYRIFTTGGAVHLVSANLHLKDTDPFELMEKLLKAGPEGGSPKNLNASHAFYLGFEMCKAWTAITLNKQYEQDNSLDWGYLTRQEKHHYLPRKGGVEP